MCPYKFMNVRIASARPARIITAADGFTLSLNGVCHDSPLYVLRSGSSFCDFAQRGNGAGENEGQDDLDKATDKKLAAENIDDLAQVIDLCESALKKGLDASNTEVANNLLTGTLMQRANFMIKTIVERTPARLATAAGFGAGRFGTGVESRSQAAAGRFVDCEIASIARRRSCGGA